MHLFGSICHFLAVAIC